MTNNWTDIGNASLVVVMGANPVENHPACMAHINVARDKGGKLIVLDPRKTRTALQCDPKRGERYIRFRPGTDIAILNGLVREIIAKMDATKDPERYDASIDAGVRAKFFEFLNHTANNTFFPDAGGGTIAVSGGSIYTDARFIVNGAGTDYERSTQSGVSNVPTKALTVDADPNTVYNRLWDHVEHYTPAVVAEISGVSPTDLEFVANAYIENSRCSSVGAVAGAGSQDPTAEGYKATTMLYAMGLTQHTCGGQNVKGFAVLQSLMGNVGRAGGGINALRGIHNVQGSTDMGNLQHLIPFYSGNPGTMTAADSNAFGKYMDNLWGNPLNGTGVRTSYDGSYDDAYNYGAMNLQQWGFLNMTYNFFGKHNPYTGDNGSWLTTPVADRTLTNGLYDLWPKTNGDPHTRMFRKMVSGDITACVVWGQNPGVTQPHQTAVRAGLKNLDLLVVVDMFETETAACDRKPDGVTYLVPACSHAEEAGSVANSGRVLQWRERAAKPKGNSKADLELLFRFAYALDGAGAFSHITTQWQSLGMGTLNAYQVLYGDRYGWTPGDAMAFEDVAGMAEVWRGDDLGPKTDDPLTSGTLAATVATPQEVKGSEWFCEQIYREMCTHVNVSGTSWLYVNGYSTGKGSNVHTGQDPWRVSNRAKSRELYDPNGTFAYPGWGYAWLVNRRVLYNNGDIPGDVGDFYMGPDSVARLFVTTNTGSGIVPGTAGTALNYSRWYRFYHRLGDMPDIGATGPHVLPNRFPAHVEPYETPYANLATTYGRNTTLNPGDLGGLGAGVEWNLVPADTPVAGKNADAAKFPLVLTSIRCVEHFQGGPITRNNPWNVEAEPKPWIEINSYDAALRGIKTGDKVNVITARSNSTTQQEGRTDDREFAEGFIARVGVGAEDNQRVGKGVVAIPWHWGDKGLSTGSRANDLCIDAGDANTTIPEYKACICEITKDLAATPDSL